jgi:glucose dehydrogenase
VPHVQRLIRAAFFLTLIAIGTWTIHAQSQGAAPGEWRYFGGDRAFTRYSPLDQINAGNVGTLQVLWRRPAVDSGLAQAFPDLEVSGNLRSTPTMIGGVLYAPNAQGFVEAFDAGTGRTLWQQEPFAITREEMSVVNPDAQDQRRRFAQSPRGMDIWASGTHRRLFTVRGEYLYALDASSGVYVREFGERGRVNLHWNHALAGPYGWTAAPIVVGDVVVIAGITNGAGDGGFKKEAAPENVRGYDVRSGRLLWVFHVVPDKDEFGAESWGKDALTYSGDLGSWCCLSADEELGYVYVPLSAPTSSVYGGHRPGDNLYSNSLVALDARTGTRVWHFQMVHHDLWEYDTVGPATLGEIVVDGKRIKAVMQPSKTGFLYVFDRVTGRPVWPIEERPVPQSTVPGEVTARTQPFPTKPPPFDRQGFTEDDLIDFTPELGARARAAIKDFVTGPLFTPPSLRSEEPGGKKGTLTMPGGWGAGNWHTGAFDPETGIYYAISHTQPGIRGVVKTIDPTATMEYAGQARARASADAQTRQGSPAAQGSEPQGAPRPAEGAPPQGPWPGEQLSIEGFPIFKPPYGRITAIDMNRGEHVWTAANGDGPRNHPLVKDLNLPPLGIPGRPAPLLTKTLLFLGEGSDALPGTNRDGMWGKKFRAYDKATGKVLWETELPAGTTGAPITYMHRGRQYIVLGIGGRKEPAEWIALGLPGAHSGTPPPGRAEVWAPLNFLLGSWETTITGKPGSGNGKREYKLALRDQFIETRTVATYPPQAQNPKGEVHEDAGYISYDQRRKTFVFRQFHGEGFVNTYVADPPQGKDVVFTSEAIENIPAGWRARETYRLVNPDEVLEIFELAEPGREFSVYSETRLRRQRP